jgi:hypothetical protein
MSDELSDFAKQYVKAWCSQSPESVAAFFAERGSLSVNDGPPAVGRAAIAEIARAFMRDFPDMVVTMDKLVRDEEGTKFHWTLTGTNTGRTGRRGKTRSNQRLRTVEDRRRRAHRTIERPFRQRGVRTPASRLTPHV